MSFKKILILLSLLIISGDLFAADLKKMTIHIVNSNNIKIPLVVEVADTDESRTYGLMNRKELAGCDGMLFLFDSERFLNFWMKNTYIKLSIAYIDKKGVIRDIQHMKPLDTTVTYPSKYPSKAALEVNQGWFEKNSISTGNIVLFHE